MINFNEPPLVGPELEYVREAIANKKICGDGPFTKLCNTWLEERFGARKALLTTSGSSALEMAAILCEVGPGDEVILPSYTFSTTATSFSNLGATLVFVDIRPDTMNIDETKIEAAITERTRVIVPMHYAGVACEMDTILNIAHSYGLKVVEDAAQGIMSAYKGRALGAIGDFGCFSFHETKNFSMGEGGAIMVNDSAYAERAEIVREKGTNRSRFFRGQVDKYTWVDRGSSYLPSDMNAAYLWAQLQEAETITANRMATWQAYANALAPFADAGRIELPTVPDGCEHNAHMFYCKLRDLDDRTAFINHMRACDVQCAFHYIPLHSAPAGRRFGRFSGEDVFTTAESDRLVRLPLYYGIERDDLEHVIDSACEFLSDSSR